MFKQSLCIGFISLAVLGQTPIVMAIAIDQVPNPRKTNGTWVSDTANLLTEDTKAKLNRMISTLEAKNGSEIAVVTVPDTSPSQSPKEFSTKLFNYWKIGKRGRNNGLLLLVSKSDRRVEIETGTGIVTQLPNSKIKTILQETIIPQLKQGKFNEGILNGTQIIVAKLGDPIFVPPSPSAAKPTEINSNSDSKGVDFVKFFTISGSEEVDFVKLFATILLLIAGLDLYKQAQMKYTDKNRSSSSSKSKSNSDSSNSDATDSSSSFSSSNSDATDSSSFSSSGISSSFSSSDISSSDFGGGSSSDFGGGSSSDFGGGSSSDFGGGSSDFGGGSSDFGGGSGGSW